MGGVIHRRVAGVEVRSSVEGIFDARLVSYDGPPDSYGSIWSPGCLTASLNREMPVICLGHEWTLPIGRGTSWRDTPAGPVLTARLDNDPDVPIARQVIAQLRSGTLTDVSIGFARAVRREPSSAELLAWGREVVEVIERADLQEVSVVALGAVPGAEVLALRSHPGSLGSSTLAREVLAGRMTAAQWRAARGHEAVRDRDVARLVDAERAADRAMATLRRSPWA